MKSIVGEMTKKELIVSIADEAAINREIWKFNKAFTD